MLMTYIATGVFFMLFPGTLIGVLNLLKISAAHATSSGDAAWIQAHGHAQLFGWIGTFILGVGFYAIPRMRLSRLLPRIAWLTWATWTTGVTLRWAGGMFGWHWRTTIAVGGTLELIAVLLFATAVFLPTPRTRDDKWRSSVLMVSASGIGLVLAVAANACESIVVSRTAAAPLFPVDFNQRFLAVATWGFIVPFMWGFSTRWVPPLLGLRKTLKPALLPSTAVLFGGVALVWFGFATAGYVVMLAAAIAFIIAFRIFEPAASEPKFRGVHQASGVFLRLAYVWLIVAATLAIVASARAFPNGYVGASRHALTVGFMVLIVFTVGPRVLPAFFGYRRLWSTNVMFASLALASIGCAIRVTSQILAYEHISTAAWHWLPLSAIVEMTAIGLFAANMALSLRTGTPADTIAEMRVYRNVTGNENA